MSVSTMLNAVKQKMNLKNDAALCRAIDVTPPVLSKLRSEKIPLGPTILVRLSEYTGMRTKDIKALVALVCVHCGRASPEGHIHTCSPQA